MGTELAVVGMNKPVTWVDPKAMKRDAGKRYLARVASSSRSPFVGRQVRANGQDGFLQIGFGDSAEQHEEMTVVINVPQTLATWQYWPEGEGPSYPYIAPIFGGADLPSREQCGPKETKYNTLKKEDEDVWKEGLILILRDPKTNELMHLQCFGNVNSKAGEFALSVADAEEIEAGKLPLVKISFEKIKLKNKQKFWGVKFDLIEWVKAAKADLPAGIATQQEAEAPKDEDDKPKRGKAKPEPEDDDDEADEAPRARKSATPKFDRHAAASRTRDEDDDEDEDEKPKRGKAKPEPDEDDEDDKPRMVSRSAVKGKAKVEDDEDDDVKPRKASRRDEDDEDDEPRPVRRRRPALN